MIRRTANYANTNHNFVIQNLEENRINTDYLPAICIIKNILGRGKPTRMSKFLQSKLGELHLDRNYNQFTPLISNQNPIWERVIRGNVKGNDYPAKQFFDILIPKYLNEFPFLGQLIIPEVSINHITQIQVDEFESQQVDFYLPQAGLIIEIDGKQHETADKDKLRDDHLRRFGNKTVRFSTQEIREENDSFLTKIDEIKNRIILFDNRLKAVNENSKLKEYIPTISDYSKAYVSQNNENKFFCATSIIRFQILLLDLLEFGYLNLKDEWDIELKTDFSFDFETLAIEDIFQWFENILQLHKVNFKRPKINLNRVNEFSKNDSLKIDFSIFKRYTDENQISNHVIFVRTDYFDHFMLFKQGNGINIQFQEFKAYDFFKNSSTDPVKYKFKFDDKEGKNDIAALEFVLLNLFGYDHYREGQIQIVSNALMGNSTIGLLPTGGGKSICFQIPIFLQPGISFVVCPIKSLMFDQKIDLFNNQITRVDHITSNNDAFERELILNDFSQGKFQFIFISPERFQVRTFRQFLTNVTKQFKICFAVIDEVHCLSEWGHDFRTSYLNLAKTIQKYCNKSARFLALTATASLNVLKDIQLELQIPDDSVKTLTNYTRPELDFRIIDDKNNKYGTLRSLIFKEHEEFNVLNNEGDNSNAGIIFTSTVNGTAGCYNISNLLSYDLKLNVGYFSGSIPLNAGVPIMTNEEFEAHKFEVQDKYKKNELPLIVATKAFGMGVNKNNVSYSIHYGIPSSMESLYQEAGRAGRNKERYTSNHARCYVLFEPTTNENINEIWKQSISIEAFRSLTEDIKGDLRSNLFMLKSGLIKEDVEFQLLFKIFETYGKPNAQGVIISTSDIKVYESIKDFDRDKEELKLVSNKSNVEKAIYRLTQLGIVNDWVVNDFIKGVYEVDFNQYSPETIKNALIYTISKYSDKNNSEKEIKEWFGRFNDLNPVAKCFKVLIFWINHHFVYNRKQSLKNIYEACSNFDFNNAAESGEKFKQQLEGYFKFSSSSFVLQHVTENSHDYKFWFDVFYKLISSGQKQIRTTEIIGFDEKIELQAGLGRFLESFDNNLGLNFISGLIRLLNNDFENNDGKDRFKKSISYLKEHNWKLTSSKNCKAEIIIETCKIVRHSEIEIRNKLAQFYIDELENDTEMLITINEWLSDDLTIRYILKKQGDLLQEFNNRIYEQFKRIG